MHGNVLLQTLLALIVVLGASKLVGALFRRFHQPPVVGEILGGILLGPSVLGRISEDAWRFVLAPEAMPALSIMAQIGVVLYMFLVGLELDLGELKRASRSAAVISLSSIAFPFALGVGFALAVGPWLASPGVPFLSFCLFFGVSMSITAFPVLARILNDQGLGRTPMGALALSCAAIDDASAWVLLALSVGVANANVVGAAITLVLAVAFVGAMLLVAGPMIARLAERAGSKALAPESLSLIFLGLLASALATEAIGVHAIFGAFVFGLTIPNKSELARGLSEKLGAFVLVFMLPAFFASAGMKAQIGILADGRQAAICAAIVAIACLGKIGGAYFGARLSGFPRRDAVAFGVLMNTRGLVELIVLNVGLEMKVITPEVYTMLVIMALATTFMTAPAFRAITAARPWATSNGAVERRRAGG